MNVRAAGALGFGPFGSTLVRRPDEGDRQPSKNSPVGKRDIPAPRLQFTPTGVKERSGDNSLFPTCDCFLRLNMGFCFCSFREWPDSVHPNGVRQPRQPQRRTSTSARRDCRIPRLNLGALRPVLRQFPSHGSGLLNSLNIGEPNRA